MNTVFKYRKELSKISGEVYRPVGEVFLRTDANRIKVPMYVDSGADITIIPRILGESLGFEVGDSRIVELSGVGKAKVPVVIRQVKMEIGNHEFDAKIAWCLEEDVPPLLGRADVFNLFMICFDEDEKEIAFEWKCLK